MGPTPVAIGRPLPAASRPAGLGGDAMPRCRAAHPGARCRLLPCRVCPLLSLDAGTVSGHGLGRGGRGAPSRELVGPGTGAPLAHHVYRSQTACGEATESSRLGAWVTAATATYES
jgi:hypothetical protein